MFLIVGNLINRDTEWAKLHARLIPRKCIDDEKRQTYRGKTRVIVRIAGQLIEMMYALLKQDAEIVSRNPAGENLPEPICDDRELHKRHRNGEYRPMKSTPHQSKVIRLPERLS